MGTVQYYQAVWFSYKELSNWAYSYFSSKDKHEEYILGRVGPTIILCLKLGVVRTWLLKLVIWDPVFKEFNLMLKDMS